MGRPKYNQKKLKIKLKFSDQKRSILGAVDDNKIGKSGIQELDQTFINNTENSLVVTSRNMGAKTKKEKDNPISKSSHNSSSFTFPLQGKAFGQPSNPTSSRNTKREVKEKGGKMAPRSSSQFKVGPPFADTKLITPLYCTFLNTQIKPNISARIDRGFDLSERNEWIGYKRNYFTIVTAFKFNNMTREEMKTNKFHIMFEGSVVNIRFFALRIVSKCCEDNTTVDLVQHTAKRDKGPQVAPPIYPALPGDLPDHLVIRESSNIRNGDKIENFNKLFHLPESFKSSRDIQLDSIIKTYPDGCISIAARYERIQFSILQQCKKYGISNKHFQLGVQLLGYIDDGSTFVLGQSFTPDLIVRGRSPANYKDVKEKNNPVSEKTKSSRIDVPKQVEIEDQDKDVALYEALIFTSESDNGLILRSKCSDDIESKKHHEPKDSEFWFSDPYDDFLHILHSFDYMDNDIGPSYELKSQKQINNRSSSFIKKNSLYHEKDDLLFVDTFKQHSKQKSKGKERKDDMFSSIFDDGELLLFQDSGNAYNTSDYVNDVDEDEEDEERSFILFRQNLDALKRHIV